MRRWVCIVALLAGFTAEDYTRSVRLRSPIAIERPLDAPPGLVGGGTRFGTTLAWWRRP
ncbi:MAG TPA: hypothetical protein VFT20_00175 [Candidatus Limnocylindrales bacterium]|nr:hypothetical protein [Candidatus Limnocylindrales bacterium]